MNQKSAEATEATVRALYDAFRERRRQDAEALLAASFTFTSPYDDKIGRATYFERCWPNGDNFASFKIEKVCADRDGAFVTYQCTDKAGKSFRNTEYLTVEGDQVTSVNVYFGAAYRRGTFVAQEPHAG